MASNHNKISDSRRKENFFENMARLRKEDREKRRAKGYTFGTAYDDAEERIEAAKQQDRPDTSTTL